MLRRDIVFDFAGEQTCPQWHYLWLVGRFDSGVGLSSRADAAVIGIFVFVGVDGGQP